MRMLENLKPRARHAKKSEGGEEVAQMLENLHPRARHHNRYTRSESVRSKAEMLENLQPRARHNEARIRHAEARGRGEMLENLQPRARHAGVKVGSLETSERTVGEGRMEENESREQVSDALESEVTEQLEAAHDAAEDLLSVAKELVEELEAELEMIDEVREELEEVEVEKPVVGGKEKKVDEAKAAIKAADAKQVENTKPVAPQKESSSNPDKPVLAEKTNLAAEKLPTPESPKLRLRGGMGKNKYSQMLENLPRRQVGGKEEL